jgi:aminoglycoside/choline kinase family phosphotransferase
MNQDTSADPRRDELTRWLEQELSADGVHVEPASADASFRRYFRATLPGRTLIVMDAPPEHEDLGPYLAVAGMLADVGLNVPRVVARDLRRGYLLLTDLGRRQYLDELRRGGDAGALYADAIRALARMQAGGAEAAQRLPLYDAALLRREMQLLPDWFLERHLQAAATDTERRLLDDTFGLLAHAALAQPQVFVHRDYHSRNLMVCPGDNPGILDFQDAVRGAVTYDLVSLLKDCYIVWPRERVLGWLRDFRREAAALGVDVGPDEATFVRWFDRMGAQRHIKVLGIFARLYYRDGKPGYLADLPRVLDYLLDVTAADAELAAFDDWLRSHVVPRFATAQARVAGTLPA